MPLELPDGFTVGDLEGEVTVLRALLTTLASAGQASHLARARRNPVQEKIYPILRGRARWRPAG